MINKVGEVPKIYVFPSYLLITTIHIWVLQVSKLEQGRVGYSQ